jgi:hypothetical protein
MGYVCIQMRRNKIPAVLIVCTLLLFRTFFASANFVDNNLHSNVSLVSAVTIVETNAVSFGNFAIGSPGGGDASIVLTPAGGRTSNNGASTTITLLSGGYGNSVYSAPGPGAYHISGAEDNANIYIQFVQTLGVPINSSNPVTLQGPASADEFLVDTFTFNKDGTDGTGDYLVADDTGNANLKVGATLHTKAGATSYPDGTYRGVFGIVASY